MSLVRPTAVVGAAFTVLEGLIDADAACAICSMPVKTPGENHVRVYACNDCFAYFHMACAQTWWDEYGTESGYLGDIRILNRSGHNCPACRAPWPERDFPVAESKVEVFLLAPNRDFSVETFSTNTIGELKAAFNEVEGIQGTSERYYFVNVGDGTRLIDDTRTLAQYGIVDGTEMRFTYHTTPHGSFAIIIRCPRNRPLPPGVGPELYVRVHDTTTVAKLQKAIASRLGVEESSFYFYAGFQGTTGYRPSGRQRLKHYSSTLRRPGKETRIDDLTKRLLDYNVLETEVLTVTEKISTVLPDGTLSAVTMVCMTGADGDTPQDVRVTSVTTVRDVKNQLVGVPPPETYTLRFADADLGDETITLEEYGIPPNSTLLLVNREV
jgi:hypothetical protein